MDLSRQFGPLVVTYLLHSTLLIAAVWLVLAVLRPRQAELRALLWKVALFAAPLTTLGAFVLPGLHWGLVIAVTPDDSPAEAARIAAYSAQLKTDVPLVFAAPAGVEERESGSDRGGLWSALDEWSGVDLAWGAALVACVLGALVALARFIAQAAWLRSLERASRPVRSRRLGRMLSRLSAMVPFRRRVALRLTPALRSPLAFGVTRCRIILPSNVLLRRLDEEQLEAMLAHELAHLARRDPLWSLLAHFVCYTLWIQPLNFFVRRQLRIEAEYLADRDALRALGHGLGLARCLTTLAEWLAAPPAPRGVPRIGVVGMANFRSTLGRRVERILDADDAMASCSRRRHLGWGAALGLLATAVLLVGPRAMSQSPQHSHPEDQTMKQTIAAVALSLSFAAPLAADEEPPAPPTATADAVKETEKEPKIAKVPESLYGFSGQMAGLVVDKDVEAGSFVFKVQEVRRVWKGNKAKEPQAAVGKTFVVEKLFGRFLDVLVVVKPGDTVEIEIKHVRGDNLQFLGESFKKIEPIKEQGPSIPEEFHGFRGILKGTLVSKDTEGGTLVFKATGVQRVWKQNKAKDVESAIGRTFHVRRISDRWLDVLLTLKEGDAIEVEAFHNEGDHLDFVGEWLKKAD